MPANHSGQVAQSVEQGTENPRVGGSIPSLATIKNATIKNISKVALSVRSNFFCWWIGFSYFTKTYQATLQTDR